MTMDYQMSLQQYVIEIGNQLTDIEGMNPTQIVGKLQKIPNSGVQPYIIQTIRTCIQHYQKDRGILKYAHIVDKLLKLPVWNQAMQNVIIQFFCDIFIFLLIQKCFNQIDELKILRKFWLKTIHPRHLQAMKDIILTETGIDIDRYFKPEVILALKTHYEKKLRLTSQEMSFHLPKTLKTSNTIYESRLLKTQQQPFVENENYMISQISKVPIISNPNNNFIRRSVSPQPMNLSNQTYRNPYTPIQPNQYYPSNPSMIENDIYRMKTNTPQRISPSPDPRDPRLAVQKRYLVPQKIVAQQQNIPFYPDKQQFINENHKRERLYSEETRTPNSAEYMNNQMQFQTQVPIQVYQNLQYQICPQPQKKMHYNQEFEIFKQSPQKNEEKVEKPRHSKILEMLRGDRMYKCKQCGKGYKNMSQYEKHTTEHFEQKLSLRQKKKQGVKLMNIDEWTLKGSNSGLQQFEQFYITLSNLTSSSKEQKISTDLFQIKDFQPLQLKCKLCNELFDLKFHIDQWVLSNATFCDLGQNLVPMHKTCQDALEESSSAQNF